MKEEFNGVNLDDDDLFIEGFKEKYSINILNTKDSLVYRYMQTSYDSPIDALKEFEKLIRDYSKKGNFPYSIAIVKSNYRILKTPISFS